MAGLGKAYYGRKKRNYSEGNSHPYANNLIKRICEVNRAIMKNVFA